MKKQVKMSDIVMLISVIAVFVSFLIAVKILSNTAEEYFERNIIVCLDAGHGASDNGAQSTDGKRLEKNDNLTLTLKIGKKLQSKGVKVLYTRNADTEITLKQRCKIANRYHALLFVSIHRNSSPTGTGIEAWISNAPKGNERVLADELVKNISDITGLESRGVKTGYRNSVNENYYVNANTNMPSLLFEVGFITNKNDNSAFDKNIEKIADSIAQSLYNYVENERTM